MNEEIRRQKLENQHQLIEKVQKIIVKEIFDKIKCKKEQEIRNDQPILSVEYEQIQYFRPKEYYTQPKTKNYEISNIKLDSIENLFGEGWKFNEKLKSQNYVVLGFLGDCSVGKTHLMNRIIGTNVPELPTQSISFINPILSSNICVIDTPGLRHPYHTFKPNYSIRAEAKKIDYIIKSITIHMSTILFYVTDKMTSSVQKELDVIKKMFLEAPHSESRNLFIIIKTIIMPINGKNAVVSIPILSPICSAVSPSSCKPFSTASSTVLPVNSTYFMLYSLLFAFSKFISLY